MRELPLAPAYPAGAGPGGAIYYHALQTTKSPGARDHLHAVGPLLQGGYPGEWKPLGGGAWSVQNGALRQTAEREFVRAIAGDKTWTEYTVDLKARKISGREGFLILFHIT